MAAAKPPERRIDMTNFERIKGMGVEEMAGFLYHNAEYLITEYGLDAEQMEEWLNSEVEK